MGRDSFLAHLSNYFAGWTGYESSIRELLGAGDHMVVIMHEHAGLRASDAVLERHLPMVWTIANGICIRFRVFQTRDQGLEGRGPGGEALCRETLMAAGLST
jgi:hypothetical protein